MLMYIPLKLIVHVIQVVRDFLPYPKRTEVG